jgi:serine/threonine protein kinase
MLASADRVPVVAEPSKLPPDCGPYRVLTCIGSGAMGTVHEAFDTRLGRTVALKRLHPHIAESPGASERFLREGRAAARIRHPHVVQVLALGNDGGAPFLAMERLDGRSLADLLESRERLTVPEALEVVLPVVAAVAAAHDAQVIHRDLKPSNVFVERGPGGQPWPKVVDFGVSAIVEGSESSVTATSEGVVGTIAYLPPEQARGTSGGSFAGDQYSLAVLLYECVTGAQPFTGATADEVLRAIVSARVEPPSQRALDVPAGFDAVIARAMSRDPGDRFASLRHFGAALLPMATDRVRTAWTAEFQNSAAADSEVRRRRGRKKAAPAAVSETVDSVRAPVLPTEVVPAKKGASVVQMYDGLALATRGDVTTILWKAPARMLRARWLFDHLDRLMEEQPEGMLTLMIILPTSAPPDRATSVESAKRLIKIRAGTRRAVVVILGDSLWQSVAKGVLRVFMPSWSSSRLQFASQVDEGITKLLRAGGPRTPKAAVVQRDVRALYAALDPTLANEA